MIFRHLEFLTTVAHEKHSALGGSFLSRDAVNALCPEVKKITLFR